jgi:hypothetical protein
MHPEERMAAMTGKRVLQHSRRPTLVALVLAGFGSVQSQPKAGEWKATADFGEFTLTVAPGGASITKIAFMFMAFKCGGGGVTISGGITVMSSWSITNNQFTITRNLNSNPIGTSWPLTITGTFTANGEQVSGTWNANVAGSTCSGSWGPIGQIVSVDESREIPRRYALGQNYPNPFNPATTIRYELPQKSAVQLTVFNALGQQVAQLVNGDMEQGFHEVRFDGKNLSSGMYFYRILAGEFVQTRTFMLLR